MRVLQQKGTSPPPRARSPHMPPPIYSDLSNVQDSTDKEKGASTNTLEREAETQLQEISHCITGDVGLVVSCSCSSTRDSITHEGPYLCSFGSGLRPNL